MSVPLSNAQALTEARRTPGGIAEVAVLAWPAVLQTLSDTAMQITDSVIVGRLGVTELGAVGFAGVWLWTLTCALVGAGTGVQTFVAQAYGARQHRACGAWAWQGLYALVPASVVWFALAGLALGPFLLVLGPSPELHARAVEYGLARLCGGPAIVAAVVLASFFRGLGDTRTPLVAAVIANVLNAVLTYGLVFGVAGLPRLGVAGAGIATAASSWLGAALLFAAFRRGALARRYGTRPRRRASRRDVTRLLRLSLPIGGQWVLDMASFAVFTTLIARMGDVQMAASQAMIQLLSLSFMQALGISIASAALVGRYVGARDMEAAERSHRSAVGLGVLLAVVVAALFLAFPETLLRAFTSDEQVLALGRPLLALGAAFQLADAVGLVTRGSLRGAGDTRWPFLVEATLAWTVRVPLVVLIAVVLDLGVIGAWLGELGYVLALGVVLLLRFHNGAWRSLRI